MSPPHPSSPHLASISLPDHQHHITFTQSVHQLQPHHLQQHSRTCSSSSSTLTPLTASSPASTSIAQAPEQFSYQHHLQHSSIDSSVHSSRDLAETYLQSPGSQSFSPASDPSPIITTPVLGSPIHQLPSASHIDKGGLGHQDRLDQHQTLSQFHQYQSQGRLRGEYQGRSIATIFHGSDFITLPLPTLSTLSRVFNNVHRANLNRCTFHSRSWNLFSQSEHRHCA